MRGERRLPGWGYPPSRPFLLLAVYYAISVLQLASVAARPPFPDTRVEALWLLAAASAGLLVATVVAWARLATAVLPAIVVGGILIAAGSAAISVGGQGQLIAGFYLAVLGMFAGYFLSARAVRGYVALATLTFGTALIVNWLLDSPAYVIAVVVLVDCVTLVVSSLVQRLRSEALLDPLTGLLNRRGLAERADALHAIDERRHLLTTVVEIVLDGFKAYNDSHGHEAGDRLLAGLAHDWNEVLRRSDLLARTGGDEFVLVLPATDRPEADVLIARMREANPFPWSAGIVGWTPGEPLPAALNLADEAMYRNKPRERHQGRDLNQRP